MAHELIHHAQYCAGQFDQNVNTSPGYAQSNQHMREMEKDAYFRGNITLFRDFEDNYKKGKNIMEEAKHAKPDFFARPESCLLLPKAPNLSPNQIAQCCYI